MTYKQELLYAMEAAECCATNMNMLALLQCLLKENAEKAAAAEEPVKPKRTTSTKTNK